jgi:3-methyladenine DNA glycosylase AlkD
MDEFRLPASPDPELVIEVVQESLKREVDPDYLEGIQQFVPGELPSYGVRVPSLRRTAKAILKQYGKEQEAILPIAMRAWTTGLRECRLIALFLMADLRLPAQVRWELGVGFLPEITNWELCDQLCSALLGQALAEDPVFMDELETWIEDPNFWVRRAAIVAPTMLRRAKYEPSLAADLDRRTLGMCAALLDDQEHYIRKAVDWSIRETIKRNYELGSCWMFEQAGGSQSQIARSTLRLAAKKLSPADRERFLTAIEKKAD